MPPFQSIRIVAMAVLVALLIAPDASIAGGPQHSGKAPRWRTLTFSEETTTSKCIGKPVTPICAVETFEACFKRSQIELCRMAYLNGESMKFHLGYSSPEYKTEYTIIKYQTVGHVPADLRDVGWIKRGDVEVHLTTRSCPLTRDTCAGEPTESFEYTTRHVGDRWFVTAHSAYDQPE
jgi:hypothetical protein